MSFSITTNKGKTAADKVKLATDKARPAGLKLYILFLEYSSSNL